MLDWSLIRRLLSGVDASRPFVASFPNVTLFAHSIGCRVAYDGRSVARGLAAWNAIKRIARVYGEPSAPPSGGLVAGALNPSGDSADAIVVVDGLDMPRSPRWVAYVDSDGALVIRWRSATARAIRDVLRKVASATVVSAGYNKGERVEQDEHEKDGSGDGEDGVGVDDRHGGGDG